MSTLLIEGGRRLSGTVEVEGNKNAALPLLAACLLTPEVCVLQNVPRIGDVEVMARLLLDLGADIVQQPRHHLDVADPRHVGEHALLGGEEAGSQQRQRRILVAFDFNRTREAAAAFNQQRRHKHRS